MITNRIKTIGALRTSSRLMPLRALLFDLDDTLIVDHAVSHHVFSLLAENISTLHLIDKKKFIDDAKRIARQLWEEGDCYSFCHAIGISAFECLWGNFSGTASELILLSNWSHRYRQEVFRQALASQKIECSSDLSRHLMQQFMVLRRNHQRLMPRAYEVIEELSKNFTLALLTNGAPDLQNEKIDASGLRNFFSEIFISGEHGIGKPKPAIFKKLLDHLGVNSNEAVMIGNSLERDIAGAHAAGIRSIWIQVPGAEERVHVQPDFTVQALEELPPLVKNF